jgi:formylglycine-generating enzyme required for sulfatase activity
MPAPGLDRLVRAVPGRHRNPAPDGTVEFVASPERPVTGVWASDTRAFTEWINDLVGTGTYARRYRLPRPEEVNDIGQTLVNASVTSVWADPEPDGQPRLWRSSSSSGPDPHTLTRSELVAATSRDALHP